jgi:hypothetical protein
VTILVDQWLWGRQLQGTRVFHLLTCFCDWKTREIPKEHVLNPRGKTGDVNQTSCQTRGQANQGGGKIKFPAIQKVTRRKK